LITILKLKTKETALEMLVDGSVCEKLVLKCFRVVVGHVEGKKVMLKCLWVDKM